MTAITPLAYLGTFACRDWILKLYAPYTLFARDDGESLKSASRAFAACLAGPAGEGVGVGFMLIESDTALRLSVYWWKNDGLSRRVLLLDPDGRPPRCEPDAAERLGSGAALQLLSREMAARLRRGTDHAAYLQDIAS